MMQNVINEIRGKLNPYINSDGAAGNLIPAPSHLPARAITRAPSEGQFPKIDVSRFLYKIPQDNYTNLPNLVPINWI